MKEKGHPEYHDVLFVDSATGFEFVCGSTIKSSQTKIFQGRTLPVVQLAISSSSHPFFVGGKQIIDTEGRVDKFKKRYQAAQAKNVQSDVVQEEAQQQVKETAATKKKLETPKKKA